MSCFHAVLDIEQNQSKQLLKVLLWGISMLRISYALVYNDAKEELLKIYGIGNKIADCILLFSLEKLEAFPIDVWIAKALSSHYGWLLSENKQEDKKWNKIGKKIDSNQYKILSETLRNYFGKYSGYAEQYLFYFMRQGEVRKW